MPCARTALLYNTTTGVSFWRFLQWTRTKLRHANVLWLFHSLKTFINLVYIDQVRTSKKTRLTYVSQISQWILYREIDDWLIIQCAGKIWKFSRHIGGVYCNQYCLECETSCSTKLGSLLSYRTLFRSTKLQERWQLRLERRGGTEWTAEGLSSFVWL
jgi:hypothetical protein